MKRFRKALLCIIMSLLFVLNSMIPALTTETVFAATPEIDTSYKSTVNEPLDIVGKTDLATWSYSSANVTTAAPTFPATSGYYGSGSTLQLFKNNVPFAPTSSDKVKFGFSTGTISTSGFSGQANQGYWQIKTSTIGFKGLVFNFISRSSNTGPRDFNTEWSTDGVSWNAFGKTYQSTGCQIKIESTSPAEQFGMALPAGAENQSTLYIRIIQKSEVSVNGGTIATGGTHGVNSLQLYGSKDPLYTTAAVTAAPDASGAILDVTPITLSCTDPGAQIYYTTDGTNPAVAVSGGAITATGSAIAYSGSFTVATQGGFKGSNPYVVKAIAINSPLLPSDVQTFSFNQQAITSNLDAKSLAKDTYAWVKGIGTYLNGNNTLYIQDGMNPGSGLCIYKSSGNFSSYVGKEIYVYGKASPYNGLMEIVPDTIDASNIIVRNETPTLPTPTKIMLNEISDKKYEGMLVALDTIKLDKVAGTDTSKYNNHKISQSSDTAILRGKGIATSVGMTGSYVNITRAVVTFNNNDTYKGAYLLTTDTAELVSTATPTVDFLTSDITSGTAVPLNSVVKLSTVTANATITYSLNGGTPVTTSGNTADVIIDAFVDGKATITVTASDGSYTTAQQSFTYTQSKVSNVTASPSSLAISPTTSITLTSSTAGAHILYTIYKNSYSDTDGTLVGSQDQVYTGPIAMDASYFPVRIVAKAVLANYLDSDSATFKYTALKAKGGEKNYYGQIHGHTAENSDGQGTLAEANVYARDVGKLDFFILTDHSNTFDKAPATDSLATIKDLNSYNTANQQWLNGKSEAAKATTSTFLCDYGYEMTWSGGPGHINTFNTTGFVSRNNTVLNNKTNDGGLQAYYQLLKDTPGSITQWNHPGATFGTFADFAYYDPTLDQRINLLEVGNGEGEVGSGGYFPSIDQYVLALDKGWHVAPTNNGDNHKKLWGTSNTCATVVYTNDYSLSGIYQAMQDLSVWATENRDLDVTYQLSSGTETYSMGTILDAPPVAAEVKVTALNRNPGTETSNIASIQLISNGGKVVDKKAYNAGSSNVTYTYAMTAPKAGYYFAMITDNKGFKAVTAPIWLGSAPKVGITSVVNSSMMPVTTETLNLKTTFFNNESTAASLKSITYTVEGEPDASETLTPSTSIAASGTGTHTFNYTPTTTGTKTIKINAVITVNGTDMICSSSVTMKVIDINSVVYVGLDASHGNEYVSGGSYPNSMANMMTLAAQNGVRVVQLNTSEELISACSNEKYKMIILNAPSRKNVTAWPNPKNYSEDEIAALKKFSENGNTLVFGIIADYAEASNADAASPKKHMAELQNQVLTAIGSTLREGDDEVMDDDMNGGKPYRLYPTEFNMSNPLMLGVVDGQTYSQYSGATIYAVDPVTSERTTTLPSTVSALVYGFPTTYSAECDNDNFGYDTTKDTFPYVTVGSNKTDKGMNNTDGIYIPKYVNPNSKVSANPEEKLLAASEYVQHANGKSSLVVVAGGSFMSNFEVAVTMENSATLPYANYNIMDNLFKAANPEKIVSVADAKKLSDGTDVIIEGTATSEINTQSTDTNTNKGFFDCIYAQDSTGGINLFPVAAGIKEGQKARFYGKIAHYQGEVELSVSKFIILNSSIKKITPKVMSTKMSMSPDNTGALVKTTGVVSNVLKDADGTVNQFTVNDGSGPAIIFINGYITKGTTLPFVTNGAVVSVTGLASIGEVASDSNMHARLRVRDRAEILNVSAEAVNEAIMKLPSVAGVKLTDETAINSAKAAYNALSEDQKALVTAANVKKLNDMSAKLAELLSAIETVSKAIKKLPSVASVKLTDEAAINSVKEAYNALSEEQKALITADDVKRLNEAATILAVLKAEKSNPTPSQPSNQTPEKVPVKTPEKGPDKAPEKPIVIKKVELDLSKEDFSDTAKEKTITIEPEAISAAIEDTKVTSVSVSMKLPEAVLNNEKANTNLVLNAEVLEKVKDTGKDLTVSVKNEDDKELYSWTFNKDALNGSKQELTDVNLSLKVSSIAKDAEFADIAQNGSNPGLVISFSQEGTLPSQASVRIYVGDQEAVKPGSSIYLYHYDPETGKLNTLPNGYQYVVDQDGYVTIDLVHCSEYVILKEKAKASQITSLLDQISVRVKKKSLSVNNSKSAHSAVAIQFPTTLELVNSLKDKTSQSAIGAVTVSYQSSNPKVATVDKKGKITAKGIGKATIKTIITLYNGKKRVVKMRVTVAK